MAATKKDSWETFNDLQSLLIQIKSLLHGTIASAEFFSDKDAEVSLVHLAKTLVEEAEDATERLSRASLKAAPGAAENQHATAEPKGDIVILPPRLVSNN
jgi:hypothetical protein